MWREKCHVCFASFPQRYVIVGVTFVCVLILYSMRDMGTVALPLMMEISNTPKIRKVNGTLCRFNEKFVETFGTPTATTGKPAGGGGEFDWPDNVVVLKTSVFEIGYIITHLPGGMIADRAGGKYLLIFSLSGSAVCNLLVPYLSHLGYYAFLAINLIIGLVSGPIFPAVTSILARWIPPEERGRYAGFVYTGMLCGYIINASVGHKIMISFGWKYGFYFAGIMGLICVVIWYIWGYSDPSEHPTIKLEESDFIERQICGITPRRELQPIPWGKMFTSMPFWAIVICQFGHNWGVHTITRDFKTFTDRLLSDPPTYTGNEIVLVTVLEWVMAILGGFVGDYVVKKKKVPLKMARKCLTGLASFGPVVSCLIASYVGCSKIRIIVFYAVGQISQGFYYTGFYVSALDISPNYAGTVMSFANGISQITLLLSPRVTKVLIEDNTISEWRSVFWISFVVVTFTTSFFLNYSKHRIMKWNNSVKESSPNEFRHTVNNVQNQN